MQAWVGLFRRSARVPASWVFGAELFANLEHARATFEARIKGERPVPPPLIVRWDVRREPEILPVTQHWITPGVDRSATLRLVPLAGLTLDLAFTPDDGTPDLTVKLNRWGHAVIVRSKEQS